MVEANTSQPEHLAEEDVGPKEAVSLQSFTELSTTIGSLSVYFWSVNPEI